VLVAIDQFNTVKAQPKAPKAKGGIGAYWKLRLLAMAVGLVWALLNMNWKTIDKYFPKLNAVLHAGTPTSQEDVRYLMGHLKQDMDKWSDSCTDDMTFGQCRASLLSNKPVLEDLKLRVSKMDEAWTNELKGSPVPEACQAEMSEIITTYKNYVGIEDNIVALLESMNTPDATSTLMVRYNGLSSQENVAWQAFRKLKKDDCKGY
jgi:hypothetical protein